MIFEKIQRYFGLLFAFAFALVMLFPYGSSRGFASIEWFERTNVSRIVGSYEWVGQLKRVVDYNTNCSRAFEKARLYKSLSFMPEGILLDLDRLCDPSEVFFYRFDPVDGVGQVDPEVAALYQEYLNLNQDYRPVSREMPPPVRLVEVKRGLLKIIDEEIPGNRKRLNEYLLFNHILVGFVFVLMVIFRRVVGVVLLFPVQMMFGLGKASAKAAVEIHRRV